MRPLTPLRHPGPAARERIVAVATRTSPVVVDLPAGTQLLEALTAAVAALKVNSAQIELLGGTLGHVSYCVPAECHDGTRAMSYSNTRTAETPVTLLSATATLGNRYATPFMHCHAIWLDTAGRLQGGHLWPDTTIGDLGIRAALYPLPGITSTSADDPETRLPVFTPERNSCEVPSNGVRAVLARVLPGQNLHDAIERTRVACGFSRAVVRASLGSFVGPVFLHGSDRPPITGPCTEFTSLMGQFEPDPTAQPTVHAAVIDAMGVVHAGTIDPGASLIAVTAEILILEGQDA